MSGGGHYGGAHSADKPRGTRQGIYAFSASGLLLASCNDLRAGTVADVLERALKAWDHTKADERTLGTRAVPLTRRRLESLYPSDGLALRVTLRDLIERDGRLERGIWNIDRAWFTADEARGFIPDDLSVGAKRTVSKAAIDRLVRLHLVDSVRGQGQAFDPGDVRRAELTSEVTRVDGPRVRLHFSGRTEAEGTRLWRDYARPDRDPGESIHGVAVRLAGDATFDRKSRRFTAFELLAVGSRWGRTQFNGRGRGPTKSSIGFAFTLMPNANDRLPPAFLALYGWSEAAVAGATPPEPPLPTTSR